LDPTTQQATAVSIPLPATAGYVSANSDATEATYCHPNATDDIYDIFLMGTDGTEHQLTTDADACGSVFSPDGKTIAYMSIPSGGNIQIWTMNADGSNQTALYAPPVGTLNAWFPEFSPDGKSIVFLVDLISAGVVPTHRPKTAHVSSWVQAHNLHAKNAVRGSAHPQDGSTPTVSGWYTMALSDTTPTLVYTPNDWWGPAVFSADGTKLLISDYDGTDWNIFSVTMAGTATEITTSTDQDDLSPVPYSNVILFNRSDTSGTGYCWDIWVMNQDGTNQKLVLAAPQNTWICLDDIYWWTD